MTLMTIHWVVTAIVVLLVAVAVAWLIDYNWCREHPDARKHRAISVVRGWMRHEH